MKTNELPPMLPFYMIATALKSFYILLNVTLIISGSLVMAVLASMSAYGFHAGIQNMAGGPGAMLLGLGAGAILLSAVLPLSRLTLRFSSRFLRKMQGSSSSPNDRFIENRTLEEAYRSGKSLANTCVLFLLGSGLSAVGIGLALDGLRMIWFPGTPLML